MSRLVLLNHKITIVFKQHVNTEIVDKLCPHVTKIVQEMTRLWEVITVPHSTFIFNLRMRDCLSTHGHGGDHANTTT